jgi:hypothetical protein
MIYSSSKEFKAAQRVDFDHTCRLVLIEYAQHVIKLAPLPELKEAIELIKWFDEESGSERTRRALQRHHDKYFRGKKWSHHPYGYTALGEIFLGIGSAVYNTLHPKSMFGSHYGQRFTEACYLATEVAAHGLPGDLWMNLPTMAQSAEYKWQDTVWKKHWDKHNKEFGSCWAVQKAKQEEKLKEAA